MLTKKIRYRKIQNPCRTQGEYMQSLTPTLKKQEFLNRTQHQIKIYNGLLAGLLSCELILKQFSGKILNARILTPIKENCLNKDLSFNIEDDKLILTDHKNRTYKSVFTNGTGYIKKHSVCFTIVVNDEKRIQREESVYNLHKEIEHLKKLIAEEETNRLVYDNHLEDLPQLASMIKEYKATYTQTLREFHCKITVVDINHI